VTRPLGTGRRENGEGSPVRFRDRRDAGWLLARRSFYEDFQQVSEAEVCELLDQAHRERPAAGSRT
jgi:predicted phosphoribosyltransferase